MIKVLLADDHKIVRDGIKFYFKEHPKFTVEYEAGNGKDALDILSHNHVDIVITDISMPGLDGVQLMMEARKIKPELPFIALTMNDDYTFIKKMLEAGVNGYVLKNCSEEEILESVEYVIKGESYFSGEVNKILVNRMMEDSRGIADKEVYLSDREKEVLTLVLEQYSNQEIAKKLFISVRTVDSHKRNMIEKTGSKNIAGLIKYALEHRVV